MAIVHLIEHGPNKRGSHCILPLRYLKTKSKTDYIKSVLEKLLKKKVTAVIAENDYVAVTVQKAFMGMGVKIPKEISLIGFDNLDVLEHVGIMLTTVEQDFYMIGKTAAEIVIEMLENDKRTQIKKITIPVKLIVKESTDICRYAGS